MTEQTAKTVKTRSEGTIKLFYCRLDSELTHESANLSMTNYKVKNIREYYQTIIIYLRVKKLRKDRQHKTT